MNLKNKKTSAHEVTLRVCVVGMLMAMNIAVSTLIKVPVPGGSIYLNDIVISTAALLLDPVSAFIVGGVGAFLADVISYPQAMFVSLVTHGLQAVVISLCARHLFRKKPILGGGIGAALGALINVLGYTLGKIYVYSTWAYAIEKLPYQTAQSLLGAAVAVILVYRCGLKKIYENLLSPRV